MNKEEIAKIKEHIEIHARLEPRAIHITEIMRRAVVELEHIVKLEKENAELKADNDARKFAMTMSEKVEKQLREENAKLKKQLENRSCSNCRRSKTGCPNDGSCHNFSLWQPLKIQNCKKGEEKKC